MDTTQAAPPHEVPAARPEIGEAEIEAVVRVMRSGHVVQGPEVAAFEEEFSDHVGGAQCVAVGSGTAALHAVLLALGIGSGDEVVVPSLSFAATANAVRLVGGEPVFADIEDEGYCVDPEAVEAAVGPRTAAVVPVHLYGHPADTDRLRALTERRGLALVEDACQAHGAALRGRPVGLLGTAGCFSFYPTKNMHTLEGGMVTTRDPALARRLRMVRNQGMEVRYSNEVVGANLRMTDVAAAVGRVQLPRLEAWVARRRSNAAVLAAGIASLPAPAVREGAEHAYNQYTVAVPNGARDRVRARLAGQGVATGVHYPVPIHRLPPYLDARGRPVPERLPRTDDAAARVLSLPVHPGLDAADLRRVAEEVDAAVRAEAADPSTGAEVPA